jgi:hypothetical protein
VKKLTKRILEKVEDRGKVKFALVQLTLGLLRPFLDVLREIEARLKLILETLV